MGLIAKDSGGGSFDPVPQGLQLGYCYGVIDLGTQYQEKWKKYVHKIILIWELPKHRIQVEDEHGTMRDLPRAISKQYTKSLHKKANLRADLESWRGTPFTEEQLKGFDLFNVLGIPAQLNVVHVAKDDRIYANISAIVPAPDMTQVDPENSFLQFSFEEWPDKGIPVGTPEWIQNIIVESKEYRGEPATQPSHSGSDIDDGGEDCIPF